MALTSFRFDMASFPLALIFISSTAMHFVICILVGSGADPPSAFAKAWSASSAMRATMSSALRIFSTSPREAQASERRRCFFASLSAFLGWGVGSFAGIFGCWGALAVVDDSLPAASEPPPLVDEAGSLVEVGFLGFCFLGCCTDCRVTPSTREAFLSLFSISPGEECVFVSPDDVAFRLGGELLLGGWRYRGFGDASEA
mmetsp:Transcript_30026/g.63692  ORF Transcript_30026/g.63692 Transcript_30026/m.63692 type:complete len:200 (+) Transcript_30026:1518-2117(+)